jgi:transglutaminase-like putative cysteine protease
LVHPSGRSGGLPVTALRPRRDAARLTVAVLLSLVLWLLAPIAMASLPPGVAFGETPAWVQGLDADAMAPAPASQGVAYRVVEDQVSLLGERPVEYRRLVYDIADRGGLEDGGRARISFHPDYQDVVVHALAVVRDGERFDRRPDSRVELMRLEERADDGILDGRRTAEFLLPDVQVGDRVEVAFSVIGGNPVFGTGFHSSFSTNYGQALAARRIRAVMPAAVSMSWKVVTGPGRFVESVVEGQRELVLDLTDVAAVVEEANLPSNFDPYGVVEVSTARDWSDVARWSVSLFKLGPAGQGALAAVARELDLKGKSPAEATREALAFVQREVRYVSLSIGESSHAPAPPETTLARRFGDCKDKSLLMVGLLAEAGIPAETVLVSTRWRETTPDRLASPLAFDHAIVRARLDGEWRYFDPTRDTEFGDFDRRGPIRFGTGLPVSEASRGLVDIGATPTPKPSVEVSQDVKMVGEDGQERALIRVHTRYRYAEADRLRQRFRAVPVETIGKEYQDYMQGWYRDIEMVTPVRSKDRTAANTFEVTEGYRAPFTKDEDAPDAIGEFDLRLFQIADWVPEARETQRRQPLSLPGPEQGTQEVRMTLDGGWDVEAETSEIRNDYFEFRRRVSARGDVLTITGEWRRLADYVPPEDYAQVRDDLREVRDLLGYAISVGGGADSDDGLVVEARDLAWPALGLLLTTVLLLLLWWLRDRSRIAGMFFAPRVTAARLMEASSVSAALGVALLSTSVTLAVGVLPDLVAGATPGWKAIGIEMLSALPHLGLNVAVIFALFRLFGRRPTYRNLFITACWSLWPLILLVPLALLAAGPAMPLLATEPASIASNAPLGWVLGLAMGLLMMAAIWWTVVASVAAHSVAAASGVGRTIAVYCLLVLITVALAVVGVLAYLYFTGALPGA